jgi:glycosyltransferase involved in cell wall biosynthesis
VKILLLAPQPFYRERGTPIAVNLLLRALAERGDRVDLLTYHEGEDVSWPNLRIVRARRPLAVRNVRPGFSLKKVLCDACMVPPAFALARRERYDVVHAVEESAFLAAALHRRYGVPFIYDMDSCLSQQLTDHRPWLRPLSPILRRAETAALRRAAAVAPVCDALADYATRVGARHIVTLRDIPLQDVIPQQPCDLRAQLGLPGPLFLYVGNLEAYQGIDLLLEAFAAFAAAAPDGALAIVGGTPPDIARCTRRAAALGLGGRVRFAGPRPLAHMADVLASADALVSPRLGGVNTPMKIYSYMAAGRAILATRAPTHTQVLDEATAVLVEPEAAALAAGLRRLAADPALRRRLGEAVRARSAERYSLAAYRRAVAALYEGIAGAP